jgi:hypothetical protein
MQYESNETITLYGSEAGESVDSKSKSLRKEKINKYLLNKVLPVVAHIVSLLIGLGIIIIISYFIE